MQIIKEYEPNKVGRDFVCGDIHGCFHDLNTALVEVRFDMLNDRLFPVGDLADRGPQSIDALTYIQFSWFHPVMGNHELMVLECYGKDADSPVGWHYQNGGSWLDVASDANIQQYASAIEQLPLIIKIGDVAICHSLMPNVSEEAIMLNPEAYADTLLWDRQRDYECTIDWARVVYAGHSIVDHPHKRGKLINIDTGAFLKYWDNDPTRHLTLVELKGA